MNCGIQLYGVRDLAETGLEKAIKAVSDLGYTSVEFAGFFDNSARDVKEMLAKNKIDIFGTHSSLKELINDYDATVAFHKEIGNKYFTVPAFKLRNQQEIDYFVDTVNELYPKLKKEGITLAFHNHANEVRPNADGSVALEQIIYRTEIALEIDAYWAYVGMGDPIALMERVKDRLIAIHIKDGDSEGNGFPLGMGTAPVADMYNFAKENNIPLVVESETLTPSGIEEARICIEYLKDLRVF